MSGSGSDIDKHDLEKHGVHDKTGHTVVYEDHAVAGESFEVGNSLYAKLQRFAGKLHIEQRGIERVPEDERTDTGFRALLNVSSMWLSANMVTSAFALGLLAKSVFYLGFVDAILTCFFFNIIGILPVCYFSTFGPRFGLRQMVLSRFWFGWWTVKLIAIFNVLACLGWSAVNAIVGAQLLQAVNNDVKGPAGIVIIAVITFVVTLFGYKVIHAYEFWVWIPTFIIFLIVLGEFAHSGEFVNIPMGVGTSELGSVLSFGATIYGFATGWTPYAADYTCYQPSNQSRTKVFIWTFMGLIFPLLFCEFLGIACNTIATLPEHAGTGVVLSHILIVPLGRFGEFCLVMLALSIVANNCPNIYSFALTVQVFGKWTQRVPRFIWTGVGTAIYIAVAIPGYDHFFEYLEYFMTFIGYWLAIYEGISLTEHFVFLRGFSGYRPEYYDQPDKLPVGIAAFIAFIFGIVGMVVGMSQPWWIGPIAKHAGAPPYGGDVGFELAFAFAAFTYFVGRTLERKHFGR